MPKLFALIAVLFFSVHTPAQLSNPGVNEKSNETASVSANKESQKKAIESKPKSKILVPPEKASPVKIPLTVAPLVIDGRLDEEAWRGAAVFKDFIQTSPGDNIAPSRPTEVMMMYDEKHLYLAFKCWDDKDKIRATVAKRDEVFGEDNVRVFLDTYDDQRRAYVLGFNPLGIQQDGIFTEGNGSDFSVDIVMESKGVIEEWGWTVEVKIPFKSLRYTAGKGKMWGFNVWRNIDRLNDEVDSWMPDDRNVSGTLIKHGRIAGLDQIKYERTLEIAPSVTIAETGSRKTTVPLSIVRRNGFDPIFNPTGVRDAGRFVNDPIKSELSLNLKYTVSPNVTLDAAINPDFAEIEADAPVVSANQRFPIFFEEKRPFFLEGKDIFDAPLSPFYSRTIVDPDLAVKLTGKTGKNTFGFLAASDNAPGNYSQDERGELDACQQSRRFFPERFIRCGIEDFVDENAYFGVLRVKRDFGKENNVGFFATARTFPKNRNFTAGFDGKFKLDSKTVMAFQVLGTHSRKNFYDSEEDRSEYRTGNGFGYFWNLDYTTDTHGWMIEAVGRSSDYRADSGFTRRTNTNSVFFANRWSTKSKPKNKIIRTNWQQFARYVYDWNGRLQELSANTGLGFNLQGNLYVNLEGGVSYEKIYEEEFGARRNAARNQAGAFFGAPTRSSTQPYASLNASKNFNKKFSMYGFVGSIFNAFDYDFGAGTDYPRRSPAFTNYLNSTEYNEYIRLLLLNPSNPNLIFPDPPALDPGRGWQFDLNVGGEYKPIDPLRISLDYTKSRLRRNDNKQVAFDTNIFSMRSTYQFTRFVYTRLRVDYDSLNRNASGQFLFGWNPNPGTAFYVGYNDNFNYRGYSPFTNQFEPGFERNSRTFFIRASYLFRKSF